MVTAIFQIFQKRDIASANSRPAHHAQFTAENQFTLYNKPITRQNKTYLIYTSVKNIHSKSKEQELDQGFQNDI